MGDERILALRGVSLDIRRNEYVAIMGPSGSGKSTFMNLLGCLDTPTGGEYWLNGQRGLGDDRRRAGPGRNGEIGFVFQTFNLLPRSTRSRTSSSRWSTPGARDRTAGAGHRGPARVGLGDRMDHRPNELSGGQRQRVAIARALVNVRPSCSPTSRPAISTASTSEEIMRVFGDLHASGQTVIMVTHEPDIAAHAERVVVLRDGRVESDRLTRGEAA